MNYHMSLLNTFAFFRMKKHDLWIMLRLSFIEAYRNFPSKATAIEVFRGLPGRTWPDSFGQYRSEFEEKVPTATWIRSVPGCPPAHIKSAYFGFHIHERAKTCRLTINNYCNPIMYVEPHKLPSGRQTGQVLTAIIGELYRLKRQESVTNAGKQQRKRWRENVGADGKILCTPLKRFRQW
jgi:hypothetical protein